MSLETIGYALVGGLLPPLIWLYFLLKEDSRCPEQRHLIIAAFIAGGLAVPLALFFEHRAVEALASGAPLIIAWAVIEETAKYALIALVILWRRAVNESLDYVIYLITAALGFAALENALFLIGPLSDGDFLGGLVTNNLRFMGATLLHVIASSAIGFALAFSYRARPILRTAYASLGLILAIALHALFNFLIIAKGGSYMLEAFFTVWTGALVFFALFEILKYVRYRRLPKNAC